MWAPNAQAVRLVSDFNYWNGEVLMHLVPGSGSGHCSSKGQHRQPLQVRGAWCRRCLAAQGRSHGAVRLRLPRTPPIVYESQYKWGDDDWMWYRGQKAMHAEPVSVYEVHTGSGAGRLTTSRLANELVEYCSWQGYTHVEFMPVAQHPFEGSWGTVTGYFAPMSKFGPG